MATKVSKAELPTLTKTELDAAREACAKCAVASKAAAAAEKEKAGALAQMFFKMGFPTMDEVKVLDPDKLAKEIEKRAGKVFDLEPDAFAEFAIAKTSEGRYPKWKQELQALNGPAVVASIEADTAKQFSYAVIEAGAVKPGTGGMFVLAPEPKKR